MAVGWNPGNSRLGSVAPPLVKNRPSKKANPLKGLIRVFEEGQVHVEMVQFEGILESICKNRHKTICSCKLSDSSEMKPD